MRINTIKNIVMLYGLSIAKIIFPLISLPYLTRVLTLEAYGVVAYVKSIMGYMQVIIDFGFITSGTKDIVECRNNKEKIGYVAGDILIARLLLACGIAAVLVVIVYAVPVLRDCKLYTALSFCSIFLSVFLYDYIFRGLEQMQIITIRFVVMRAVSTALTFVLIKSDFDILWIPILEILATLIAIAWIFIYMKKIHIVVRVSCVKNILQKLKESSIYFASNMMTTVFGALNTFIIGLCLPATDIAFWSICMQLIGAVQMFYYPISDGVYPDMISARDLKQIKRILLIIMPIILLGCVFCIFAAKFILTVVGGQQYVDAVFLFRALVPVLFFSFPAILLGWPTLGVINKEKIVTQTTIIAAVFQVVGLVLLGTFNVFTLLSIAVLRSLTEIVLMSTRAIYTYKYKAEFT